MESKNESPKINFRTFILGIQIFVLPCSTAVENKNVILKMKVRKLIFGLSFLEIVFLTLQQVCSLTEKNMALLKKKILVHSLIPFVLLMNSKLGHTSFSPWNLYSFRHPYGDGSSN